MKKNISILVGFFMPIIGVIWAQSSSTPFGNGGSTSYITQTPSQSHIDWFKSFHEADSRLRNYNLTSTRGSPGYAIVTSLPAGYAEVYSLTNNPNPAYSTLGLVTNLYQPGFWYQKIWDGDVTNLKDVGGWDVNFTTSSTNVIWSYQNDPNNAWYYRVLMDGNEIVPVQTVSPAIGTNWLAFGAFNDGFRSRDFTIQIGGVGISGSISVLNSNIVVTPYTSQAPKLFCLSDSTGGQYGVDHLPWLGMTRMFGYALGFNTYSLASGSSGYTYWGNDTNFLSRITRDIEPRGIIQDGDVFWFLGGATDVVSLGQNSSQVYTNALNTFRYVRSRYPNSTILACPDPTFYNDIPSWYPTFATGVSNAASNVNNCYFANSLWTRSTSTNFFINSSDAHFNSKAHELFTRQALEAFRKQIQGE